LAGAGCLRHDHTSLPEPGRPKLGLLPLPDFGVDEPDPWRCIEVPPIFDKRFRTIGLIAFVADDTPFAIVSLDKMTSTFVCC